MDLATPLTYVKGVGPARAAMLEAKGLQTVEDLLGYVPFRYEDRTSFTPLVDIRAGEFATVSVEVITTTVHPTRRRGFKIFEMLVRDGSGVGKAVYFNQPFMLNVFHPGQQVILYGKTELLGTHGIQFKNPDYEVISQDAELETHPEDPTPHMGRVVPVYQKIGSMTARQQRTIVYAALDKLPVDLPDSLPAEILAKRGLPALVPSLRELHFPSPGTQSGQLNAFRTPAHTDFGAPGYGGPCPPPGDKPHRYIFTVFALKAPKIDLDASASAAVIGFNLNANVLAKATVTAYYGR